MTVDAKSRPPIHQRKLGIGFRSITRLFATVAILLKFVSPVLMQFEFVITTPSALDFKLHHCRNSDMNRSQIDKSSNRLMPCSSRQSAIGQAKTPLFRRARLLMSSFGNPSSPRLRSYLRVDSSQ